MADKNTKILEDRELDAKERINRFLFDDMVKGRGTNFAREGTAPQETKESENFILLQEGDHKGIQIVKKQTVLMGQAGAKFTAPVIIQNGGSAIFSGCYFEQTPQNTDFLVKIQEGGRAIFNNCVFKRFDVKNKEKVGKPAANACYIALETSLLGENLGIITNCVFREDAPSGASQVVNNVGTAGGTIEFYLSINQTGLVIGVPSTGVIT